MAEKSFTEKQKEIVARKMGYEGPMNMFDEYLKSSPADARKYGAIVDLYMAKGGMVKSKKKVKKYAEGGSVESLYSSILGRAPDPEGLAYWQQAAASGQSLSSIAEAFKASPEAQAKAAAPAPTPTTPRPATSGAQPAPMPTATATAPGPTAGASNMPQITYDANDPVVKLYKDVLGREPDPEGFKFWKGELAKGVPISQIQTSIARSPEKTASLIPDLYKSALGRDPEPEGLAFWQDQAAKGASFEEIRAAFNATPEKTVVDLYRNYLGREPDPEGLEYWLNEIRKGASLDGVREAFANTPEFKEKNPTLTKIPPPPPAPPPRTDGKTTLPTGRTIPPPVKPTAPQVTPQTITAEQDQFMATELAPAQATTAQATQATTAQAGAPTPTAAATMQAAQAAPSVQAATQQMQPAQGTVSQQAQVQAAQMEPTSTAVGQLQAAQGVAREVTGAPTRTMVAGEMIEGPTVDRAQVERTLAQAEAAQGVVTEDMTVQGQLAKLTSNFEAGNPPAWAAASLRNATAQMSARGLGASSLAGQALVQAALEAALPIASADAAIYQQMGMQNLSNRQQVAMLTAQQRAQFLGQEFDQAFQTRVTNAARVADIANMNFTAQQQVALENARLAQTMDLANLNNQQAIVMANAAQIANLETANLNNRQQEAVLNAKAFLDMDMANLSNLQQTEMFKSQSIVQSLLTDASATNAARQFNATSENQTNQFFANLTAQVKQFNAQQTNAMSQFNTEQANTIARFNAETQNLRDQFNAQNRLIIDQSNAQWRREISTANTAAINRANEFNATKAMELTTIEYNNMWQQVRDEIEYSWKSAENNADRLNRLAVAEISANASILAATMAKDAEITKTIGAAAGSIFGDVTGKAIGSIFDWGVKQADSVVDWVGGLFTSGPERLA